MKILRDRCEAVRMNPHEIAQVLASIHAGLTPLPEDDTRASGYVTLGPINENYYNLARAAVEQAARFMLLADIALARGE